MRMPIKVNHYVCIDFETNGLDPHTCFPIEIAAKVYNGRSLEPIPNAEFSEYCKPPEGTIIEPKIWDITKIDPKAIDSASSIKLVYPKFIEFVGKYNVEGNKWTAPIVCGFNSNRYDVIIHNRMLAEYGKKGKNTICFSPMRQVDLYDLIYYWFSNTKELEGYSLNDLRRYMGISTDGAHRAMKDVEDTAKIFFRFMKFHRELSEIYTPRFKGCFSEDVNNVETTVSL
jgi:DNA polymerase III epsilon subunit-like protein